MTPATSFPLTFDEDGHRYQWRGQDVPSVTQILSDMRLSPPYPADKGWLEFGRVVHKCCELLLRNRLEISGDTYPGTSPLLWPYLNAFRQKVQEYRIVPIKTECLLYHDLLGFAGTLDLNGCIFAGEEVIIDYKTGAPPECVALQTAAYDLALSRMQGTNKRRRRFALHLFTDEVKETGRAKMIEFVDPFAYEAFTAACNLWKWTRRNGRKL